MWDDEPDLTPEPWHTAELPWLEDGEGIAPWDAPSAEECLEMVGPAYALWARGYQYEGA
jgi:hypothetical protein